MYVFWCDETTLTWSLAKLNLNRWLPWDLCWLQKSCPLLLRWIRTPPELRDKLLGPNEVQPLLCWERKELVAAGPFPSKQLSTRGCILPTAAQFCCHVYETLYDQKLVYSRLCRLWNCMPSRNACVIIKQSPATPLKLHYCPFVKWLLELDKPRKMDWLRKLARPTLLSA